MIGSRTYEALHGRPILVLDWGGHEQATTAAERRVLAQRIRQFIVDIDMWRSLGQAGHDAKASKQGTETDLRSPLSVLDTNNAFKSPAAQ
eukprot:scaffold7477_cov538-Prasinococcus_capsulatus_cf.AAC.1